MNKKKVNEYLNYAYDAISLSGILDKQTKKVKKSFRSQISAFGASISMGSPKAAIAFFSKQGGSKTERPKILYAIYLTLNKDTIQNDENKSFNDESSNSIVSDNEEDKNSDGTTLNKDEKNSAEKENDDKKLKEKCSEAAAKLFKKLNNEYTTDDIINAAIAVKLAMNLYELDEE